MKPSTYYDVLQLHGKEVTLDVAGGTIKGTFYMGAGCGTPEEYGLHFNIGNPIGKMKRKYQLISSNMDATKFDVNTDEQGNIILLFVG